MLTTKTVSDAKRGENGAGEHKMELAKAKLYKTAKALVACAHFQVGEYVAIENPWRGDNGIMWFDVVKNERGDIPRVAYPETHLTQFCL